LERESEKKFEEMKEKPRKRVESLSKDAKTSTF